MAAEGLASPSWGHTFKFRESDNGTFQGFYVGAGPYLSMQTSAADRPRAGRPVGEPDPGIHPEHQLLPVERYGEPVGAGGDRRVPRALRVAGWWGSGSELDGLYIGANYHYLHGFGYENFEPDARLDTNAQGLLTVNPSLGLPVTIARTLLEEEGASPSTLGVAAVIDRWEFGFGVNGIANRMDWTDVERTNYALDSLFFGGEFVDLPTVPVADERRGAPGRRPGQRRVQR